MKTTVLAVLGLFILQLDRGCSEPRFNQEPNDYMGFEKNFDRLSSTFVGGQNPSYEWFHNGSKIDNDMRTNLVIGSTVRFLTRTLARQGIYQLFVSSNMGKIFGREIRVEFIVVGKFLDKTKKTLNVVLGRPFEIECPSHGFTQNAGYKWGGTNEITGTWFYNEKANGLVLDDGRLFFSHITREDVNLIKQEDGIGCLLEAAHNEDIKLEQSGLFELNVTGEETKSFGPHLQKIPDQEVVEGSSVWLKCVAAGYPTPTYEWKKTDRLGITSKVIAAGGVILQDFDKELIIKNIMKQRHAGTYTCYATVDHKDGIKNTTQESARVIIREKPAWVQGTLITSATPDMYSQHTWTCMAKGDPEPEYNWYANATIMNNVSGRHTIEGGILTFHRVTPEDDGMYQCTAKNKFGFTYQTVSLKVKVKSPEITQPLSRYNFVAGNNGTISCVSDAIPPASHQWMFNRLKLEPNKTTKYELTDKQDLIVHDLNQADTGTYTCVATNAYGRDTKVGYFKVAEIMFKRRPENKTMVIQGTVFSLVCEAESDPPLNINYKWLFDGKELQLSGINHNWDVSTHTLTVSNAQARASGMYECIAYSSTSQKSSSATVIVRALPDPPEDLTLNGTCTDRTARLTWVIPYRNLYEPLTRILIQWSVLGDASTWYNFNDHVAGSANGHVVKELNPYSDIVFRVIAANAVGMGKPSNTTTKECKTPAATPTVCATNIQGNSTRPHNINVTWQDVKPVNHNGPGFGYKVNYRPQGSGMWYTKTILYGNRPQLVIQNTSANQVWDVQVQSYNNEGNGSRCPIAKAQSGNEAEIMFSIRPEDKTDVEKGSSFSLRCEAYSNPPLPIGYKWLHKGKELSHTGTTYTVSVAELKDSGRYECVAYVKSSLYNAKKSSALTVIVRGTPDPPRDILLSGTCSNASANLTWTIDRNVNQPLTNILIQWRRKDTRTWLNVNDHVVGSASGHVVQGLKPYSDLVFRIIAVNERGESEPSDSTSGQECKTPEAKPTVCPKDVKGSAKLQTIVITWKAVPQIDQNGPDFAYNVSFRKPGSAWQHEVIMDAESYTISKAGVGQLWEFRVQSKNAQGDGPECSIKQARTEKKAPQLAPQSLKCKEIGADYVILEWTTVDTSGVEGYQLTYWYKDATETIVRRATGTCNDESNSCISRIEGPSKRNYTQGNLTSHKEYTMFLQAYNLVGLGPKSDPLTLTTKEGKPGPPKHVKITPYGRYFNITWKPPTEPNGVIIGYVLGIMNGTNVNVSGSTRVYLFKDLEPSKEYVVYINAKTSAGLGDTVKQMNSTTLVRAPAVPRPPSVRGVSSDTVNVTYNPSTESGGFPEKFYILYKKKGDQNLTKTNATLIKNNGEESYIMISGLKSNQHYLFATVVVNENMESGRSKFTEGHPILVEEVSENTPIYRRFWFYIILAIILLLLLLLLLLLFIRRKPKRTYKVGEREKSRAVDDSIEMGEEHPLKDAEVKEDELQGKRYDPIVPTKTEDPVLASSPPRSNATASRDSLDAYDGSEDDFSETGSFIGQYGDGKKPAEGESTPSFV